MKPTVTVYVVSHNYGKFLEEAVESVLRQSFKDWELLLIDDGSTDDTPEVINQYKGDSRIRCFQTQGIGLPAVCNLALKEAQGEYLIRLDGDDLFDENILLVLTHHLGNCSECSLVFPDYYLIDERGEIFSHERREKLFDKDHVLDVPANGACTLIRKSVLQEVGGYREDLGAQDGYDLWNKIKGKYKPANVNLPLFYYRRHQKNLTNNTSHLLNAHQSIKRDCVLDRLETVRPITALIPCRRNYDFKVDVWKAPLNQVSLLERDIKKCLQSSFIDNVVVASDNSDVCDVLEKFDDSRLKYFARLPEETIRSASLVSTLTRLNHEIDPKSQGLTVLSYLQAPFVKPTTFEEAISTLVVNRADCAIGVQEVLDPIYNRGGHGLVRLNPSRGFHSTHDLIFKEANTAFAFRNQNLNTGSLTGPLAVHFLVSPDECFFINSDQSLKIAEILDQD